jgi:uncharacterized protein YjiS (DUF1127 family)
MADENMGKICYITSITKKENVMLRKIYRTILLGQAASAARKTLAMMSDSDLKDLGFSRYNFESAVITSVREHLDKREAEISAKQVMKAIVNPNLVGVV